MKNITKILITILSLTLLFSVSCSLDDKTGGGGVSPTSPEADSEISPSSPADSGGSGTGTERNLSYYAGTWTYKRDNSNTMTVIIQSNGAMNLNFSNYSNFSIPESERVITIAASNITRVNDTNYTCNYTNTRRNKLDANFKFPTDTNGVFYIEYYWSNQTRNCRFDNYKFDRN